MVLDWELSGRRIPDGGLGGIDTDQLPCVLIRDISEDEYRHHLQEWVERDLLPTRHCEWRPAERSRGEVVAVEMPSIYHESAVRAIDLAINEAQARSGILLFQRLTNLGSALQPGGRPNGSWAPGYTQTEIRQLKEQGAIVISTLISEVGVSQDFHEIEAKIVSGYHATKTALPKLFIGVRVVPFLHGRRQPAMSIPPEVPDLFCEVRVHHRDVESRLDLIQKVSAGRVDEQGQRQSPTHADRIIALPCSLLFYGRSVPRQLSGQTNLNVKGGDILHFIRAAIQSQIVADSPERV